MVGNLVSRVPDDCSQLSNLRILDCRRNKLVDLTAICLLPKLETLLADHNSVHTLELSLGPSVAEVDASHNDITQLTLMPGPIGQPYALRTLDVSYAKLSTLDNFALSNLTSLRILRLDHNRIRHIPDQIGDLHSLISLSCSNNQLTALPSSIGFLQKLEILDAHNNSIQDIPATIWNCASLININFTSNLIHTWHEPSAVTPRSESLPSLRSGSIASIRKGSVAGSVRNGLSPPSLPPLVYSLEQLFLGENKFGDEPLGLLGSFTELHVLNLSFNEIQELPPSFFRNLTKLEELYLSGNSLSTIPTEDLHRLTRLQVLFLNGNKLQTLPQELGKIQSLAALDVGSNVLKYNINNWEFDWNW
jgi:adenylate cyclase